ncbi:MAG: hypothetical protein HC848_10305 [Limnobacter sp.]|nr:hypothetical protein [Limnobacter sp.]
MPGKVFAVFVEVGQQVVLGQALLGLEAMKMEHTLAAEHAAVVKAVWCAQGDQVAEGTQLIELGYTP